jgi:hypothetical protein
MKNDNGADGIGFPMPARHKAFDVYLNGKEIDTVFYSAGANVDAEEVRQSLINHDGYNGRIVVRERK